MAISLGGGSFARVAPQLASLQMQQLWWQLSAKLSEWIMTEWI